MKRVLKREKGGSENDRPKIVPLVPGGTNATVQSHSSKGILHWVGRTMLIRSKEQKEEQLLKIYHKQDTVISLCIFNCYNNLLRFKLHYPLFSNWGKWNSKLNNVNQKAFCFMDPDLSQSLSSNFFFLWRFSRKDTY